MRLSVPVPVVRKEMLLGGVYGAKSVPVVEPRRKELRRWLSPHRQRGTSPTVGDPQVAGRVVGADPDVVVHARVPDVDLDLAALAGGAKRNVQIIETV